MSALNESVVENAPVGLSEELTYLIEPGRFLVSRELRE
jgi:hypothetical protein